MLNGTFDGAAEDPGLQRCEPAPALRQGDRRQPIQHRAREPLDYASCRVLHATGANHALLSRALEVCAAAAALGDCSDVDALLRAATELARNVVGLERVAFYMRDADAETVLLRGTWGTGAHGETTSEQGLFHEISLEHVVRLLQARSSNPTSWCRRQALLYASDTGRSEVTGIGWIMVTPLLAFGHLVGVMYNDAAFTHTEADPIKQALAAVLCSMVSAEYARRVGPLDWKAGIRRPRRPTLAQRVQRALAADLRCTGRALAREFGVSGGFLAREFKREMGVSLVEYRNRARLECFQRLMREQGPSLSLKQAASKAGFGSYAQFNRVHRSTFGVSAAAAYPERTEYRAASSRSGGAHAVLETPCPRG